MKPATAPAERRLALAPPAHLAHIVRYVHVEQSSGGAVTVPATRNAMLTFFLAGGTLAAPGDSVAASRAPILCGPLTRPQWVHWLPDTSFVTAHLAPEWLPLLFGVQADQLADRAIRLDDTPVRRQAADLDERLQGLGGPRRWAAALCAWLTALLRSPAGSSAPFIVPPSLLQYSTEDIAARYGLGTRQLERRYRAAYGLTMRESRRMQRYVAALSALLRTPPRHGQMTQIAVNAGFYDQAHMIREVAHFTSLAPKALVGGVANGERHLRLYRYDEPSRDIVLGVR